MPRQSAQRSSSSCLLHRLALSSSALLVLLLLHVNLPQTVHSAPQYQFIDKYEYKKSANSSYTYQSVDGGQRGYNYAFGDSFASGYKTKNVPHHTTTPVIIHAPNNRSFVKFGIRRPDDELVFLESKHSQANAENKQSIVFETEAADHQFSHVELFTSDPNFVLKTEFKDNYLLARFTYTGPEQASQRHATINVYGFRKDRLPSGCFLYYYDCGIKQ